MSFGTIADDYNRLRSGPPGAAIEWLVPDGCRVAVDLGAGTGLLARALARRASEVIAVEPDERMRNVLEAESPGIHAVAGKAEAIPLPDATADGLFISSAWHWMDPEIATWEIARVLRDGGRFGVIWTSRDRDVDWIREVDWLREPTRLHNAGIQPPEAGQPQADEWPPRGPRRREVNLPQSSPFTDKQTASFSFTRTMDRDDFVEMIGTYSGIITASPQDRAATLDVVRNVLDRRFPGQSTVDVPMRSTCWRATRTPR